MKRISILLTICLLASMGAWAQDETPYRVIDTTLVFNESTFTVGNHETTGYQYVTLANQEEKPMWTKPTEEKATVPWFNLKCFVARDESLADVWCTPEEEVLFAEDLQILLPALKKLEEDFPKNRVYSSDFERKVNAEHTGFIHYYLLYISPFRYDAQQGNLYLYKKIHLKMRIQKNPPTVIKVCGTVKDQDGQPVPNATLTFAGQQYDINEDGQYQMLLSLTTYSDGHTDKTSGTMEVKADGYTSHTHPKTFDEYWKNDKPIDFILYNQLHFQPGKRYSIILPETPDASLGRYYSLHHVEDGKIIFERDPSPRANTPYIFFPEYEATISLGNMDLTQTPGCTIVNEDPNSQTAESDSRVFFEGFYTTGARSQYYLAPIYSVRKIEEEAYYQEGNGRYLFDAMHAILFYRWNLFSSTPELVFRDSIDVPTAIHDTPVQQMVNGKHVNSKCYDLSGRRINNGQLPRGVYIKDGRKMVVR